MLDGVFIVKTDKYMNNLYCGDEIKIHEEGIEIDSEHPIWENDKVFTFAEKEFSRDVTGKIGYYEHTCQFVFIPNETENVPYCIKPICDEDIKTIEKINANTEDNCPVCGFNIGSERLNKLGYCPICGFKIGDVNG